MFFISTVTLYNIKNSFLNLLKTKYIKILPFSLLNKEEFRDFYRLLGVAGQ
jgi:hypothetical protein